MNHPAFDPTKKGATPDTNLEDMEIIRSLPKEQRGTHINTMIERNIPFVKYKVDVFLDLFPSETFIYDDLISCGLLALTEAINELSEKETPAGGGNPTGYIGNRIVWALGKCVKQSHQEKIPDKYQPIINHDNDIGLIDNIDSLLHVCPTLEHAIIVVLRWYGYTWDEILHGFQASSTAIDNLNQMEPRADWESVASHGLGSTYHFLTFMRHEIQENYERLIGE